MSSFAAAADWRALEGSDHEVTRFRVRVIGGRYRVEQTLGEGGCGVVYRVLDQSSGERLALKQLKPLGPGRTQASRRGELGFRREFHTLTSLRHPNIVQVHDFGVDPKGLYYTMELLDGGDQRAEPLEPLRVSKILLDVASALAFLHARRLIHGDISRRNVGCTPKGVAKLLDFGLLVTVGDLGRGRGTLPYMAPEVARRAPLDHRTDLFSLGALAYLLLTGRHAYPVDGPADQERIWARPPSPPAAVVSEIPRELGELVSSMLSVDPLGRPSSAAEVIDRLRAVSSAPELTGAKVARGYLASAALVGREQEMSALRGALARTRQGQGAALLLEAPSGMGKSRLLREIAVEAQMAGATVLSVGCGSRGPYEALHGLLGQLLRASTPPDGLTALHQRDDVVRALQRWVGVDERQGGAALDRAQLQRLLAERVLGEGARQPVVLAVDDVQRCDEASAAVLASIAFQVSAHPVMLVCALRTDETPRSPAPLGQLRQHGARLALEGLAADEVRDLVRAIFGDVDHVERLAGWMHGASGGSPLRCTELARRLVEQGKIRYQDGVWRIPEAIGAGSLPRDLVDAMGERIAALSADGLELAETLAIHGGELSLELCVALSSEHGVEDIFDALDELVQNEFLIGGRDRLCFRHDGIREALLAGMSESRRRQLHLRVGRMLQRADGPAEAIGWHLLRGGAELEAAALLAAAGRRHFQAQSFADAVGPLEAALEVFERHRVSPARRCELRQDLVRAGLICNREVAQRHGGPLIEELRRYSGMVTVERLRPWLGRVAALVVGLLLAGLRWILAGPGRCGVAPYRALRSYVSMTNYVAAVRALSFDIDGVRELPALLDPLPPRALGVRSARWLGESFELILSGHWERVRANAVRYLASVPTLRRLAPTPFDVSLGTGAMRFMLAFVTAHRAGDKCLEHLERLEAMDLSFLEVSGRVGRLLYHRLRGEEPEAQRLEAEARVLMVQLGTMWLWESLLVWISAVAHCMTRNLPALRRSIEEMELLVAQGVRAEPVLTLAQGVYHQERGELEASRRLLTRLAHGEFCRGNPLIRQAALSALARTLLLQGDLHGAVAVARQGAEEGQDPETGIMHFHVLSAGILAVAHACAGDRGRAVRRLEKLLSELPDNPLLRGTLHEYTARVAHEAGDVVRAVEHLEYVGHWFRSTGNPALAARVEKLAAEIHAGQGRQRRLTERQTIPFA